MYEYEHQDSAHTFTQMPSVSNQWAATTTDTRKQYNGTLTVTYIFNNVVKCCFHGLINAHRSLKPDGLLWRSAWLNAIRYQRKKKNMEKHNHA